MKFKKSIIAMATAATIVAPVASVVACASTHTGGNTVEEGKIVIGYKPDLDPLLALGAPIGSAPESSGWKGFPDGNKNPNISKYQAQMDKLLVNKALWDGDNIDEEYWRSLAGGKKYILAPEQWIKTPQKDFIKKDPIVEGAYMDYNNGYSGEVYKMAIEGGKSITLENKTAKNYDDPQNIWQIRSMDEIVRGAAKSLDSVYKDVDYSVRAENIIKVTNNHWNQLNELRASEAKGADANTAVKDDFKWTESEDKNLPLASDQEETLLVLNLGKDDKTLDKLHISTPSEIRGPYVKGQFKMPVFTAAQAATVAASSTHYKSKDGDIVATMSSRTSNGLSISGDESHPLDDAFFKDWNKKVDKIVIGIPNDSMASEATIKAFWDERPGIKAKIELLLSEKNSKSGKTSTWENSIVSVSNNIAGTNAYWNRMPLGQNAMVDSMIEAWYKPAATNTALADIYNQSKVWSFQ